MTDYPSLNGLVLLIGPPGAGKSTFARKLVTQQGLDYEAHISNDIIAKDLFGVSIDRGDKDGAIFAEQDKRIAERLENGRVAIVDATNVKPEARKRLIAIAQNYDQPVTAFCFHRDVATLLKQNQMREVKVPEKMVREYATLMDDVTEEQLRSEGIATVFEVPQMEYSNHKMPPHVQRLFKIVFVAILIFSTYHFVRDIVQTFDWHTSFSNVGHRSHEWCGQYCDYVTYPLDIAGIVIPIIVLRRGRVGILGYALLASMPLWIVFSVLP